MQALRRMLIEHPMSLVWPVVIFCIILGVGWLVRSFVMRGLRAFSSRTQSRPALILIEALHGPMLIWTVILGVHLAVESADLPARFTAWSAKTLLVLWIISLTVMGMRLAGNIVRHYGDQVPNALPVTTLTESLAEIAVVLIGIVLLMKAVGVEITPILTALGVGGLAVALALQDTLSNLFAGFYVAVARQIRMGDYIKLNSGEEGYVSDIGWRNTTIRGLNNNLIIIPNAKLAQAIVTNYYLPEKRMSSSVQVRVSYSSDPDLVESVLLKVAEECTGNVTGLLAEPKPSVSFDPGFGDSELLFTLGYQVAEFANQFGVRHELRKRILKRFREEGIEIPFPSRAVYLQQRGERESPS